jgi:hypothetical protein
MSEHKTGSSLTAEDRQLYHERREKGVRGQIGAVTVHDITKDGEKVPVSDHLSARLSTGKQDGRRAQRRQAWREWRREQRKASGRGE